MSTRPRSLRRRLALTTGGVFLLVGVVLLFIEFVVLTTVIEQSVSATSGGSSQSPAEQQAVGAVLQVASELQTAVMVISAVVVVLLSAVTGLLAWRVASLSLNRVSDVTALARDLSDKQLSARLNLGGPPDEIKDLGDTFDAMLDRLEASFRAQEQFVSSASHELRTPIAAVRAALEPPLVRGRFGDDVQPAVKRALSAAQRAEILLRSLLQLARPTTAAPPAQPVRLDDIGEGLVEGLAEQARSAGVTVTVSSEPVTVSGDQVLLTQMTLNLLDNAMKYNVPHGWVTVKVERVGITARMIVENSSDMVHRDVEELLKPFNRGHHTRQSGDAPDGAGLGLAIVQMIATQHDGTVSLSARQRGQLTVTVELPAVDDDAGQQEAGVGISHAPALE